MSDKERLLPDSDEVKIKGNLEKWDDLVTFFYDPSTDEYFAKDLLEWGTYMCYKPGLICHFKN